MGVAAGLEFSIFATRIFTEPRENALNYAKDRRYKGEL